MSEFPAAHVQLFLDNTKEKFYSLSSFGYLVNIQSIEQDMVYMYRAKNANANGNFTDQYMYIRLVYIFQMQWVMVICLTHRDGVRARGGWEVRRRGLGGLVEEKV